MAQPQKNHTAETIPCALCGQEISRSARACPWCGSDEKTGWSDNTYLDGLSLGADQEEYEDLKEQEFGGDSKPHHKQLIIPLIALGVLIAMVAGLLCR